MNINVVLGPFLGIPPEHCGAVEKVWLNLSRAFVETGHRVRLVVRRGNTPHAPEDGIELLEVKSIDKNGKRLHDLTADLMYSMRAVMRARPADLTVVNSFWLPVLAPLRRSLGRIVYNVQRMPKRQFALYGGTDLFCVVSGAVRDAILQQTPRLRSKVTVIGNAVDIRTFAFAEKAAAVNRILYVGRIHPEKGLALLVRAMRKVVREHPSAELRIVGPSAEREGGGGEDFVRQLREEAEGLPVHFAAPIYDDRVLAAELRDAAVFAYPTLAERGETFGLAVLEAMSCGLIPVVSSLDCFRDYIDDGTTGFRFDHRAAQPEEQLADRLLQVLAMSDDANRRARAASRAAAERFSVGAIARQYLAAFDGLLP